jgi:hypothetical protein
MTGAPRVHRYGDGEFMLAYGPNDGPQILVLQPLFEELNRCRALVAALCRALSDQGIGCWLPDWPGTGESLRALDTVGWQAWLDAVEQAAIVVRQETGSEPRPAAIRGGALLDHAVAGPRWRLSPTTGRSLLSDLRRSALAGGGDPAAPAGYRLSADLIAHLEGADVTGEGRTLRVASDTRPADLRLDMAPLWRRPEPVADPDAARALALDIAAWVRA